MNTPIRYLSRLSALLLSVCPAVGLLTSPVFSQTTYYWDGNAATTGSGATTLAGNWGGGSASAFWGTLIDGTSATTAATITSSDTVVFSANDGSGTANNWNTGYTVTLGAAQSVAGIVINGASVGSGNTGGTLTLAGTGSPGLTIGAGGLTINGSNGDPTLAATIGTITLGDDQTWNVYNAHKYSVAAAVAGNAGSGSTRMWTLGYLTPYTNDYSGIISNGSGGGDLAITVNNTNGVSTGTGVHNISGTANTYTGKTTISRGILQITSLKNVGGGSSSLGAVTTVGNGTIDIGSGTNSGSLYYNGSAASTSDRVINLAGSTGGATISSLSATAANTLTLTSNITAATGNKTLTLQGTNTGANTISGIIGDPDGASKISLVKSEGGRWVLGGANTYSGGTTINAGTLSVGATGTLGQNVVGNNVTIAGGNLLLGAGTNIGSNQAISITAAGGGIGVAFTPVSFPTLTDNSGSTGGVFGLNYTGTGGIGSVTGIDSLFTSSSYWFLGSFVGGSGTYTGNSLTAGNGGNYRLGGGGGILTMQNNVLTGANNLIVGSTGGGTVIMSGANTYSGKTTLQNGTLSVSSVNKVSGGSASSSLGAPVTIGDGTINIGSGSNAVTFNYTGTGETTDRVLNFTGTTGGVTFTNTGTGNLNFTGTSTFTGAGAKAFVLGTTADAFGGTLGPILDNGGVTTVTKNGLTNSTWTLNGTNTYTGTTQINGGVLSNSGVLASSARINLAGGGTNFAILQGQGTITRQLGAGASRLDWAANGGFAAKGGKLTLTLTNNTGVAAGALTWGAGSFMGTGITPMVFGSSTADNQVELTNNFTLGDNVSANFNRYIHVEKGVGGDSALLSGVISVGGGTSSLNGFVKSGAGTLILSGNNTYTGTTTFSNATSGILLINGNQTAATGAVTVSTGNTLGGSGIIGGGTTVNSGAFLTPGGTEGGTGVLTFNNGLVMNGTTTLQVLSAGTRGTAYDAVNIAAGTFTGTGALVINFSSFLGDAASFDLFGGAAFNALPVFTSVTATGVYAGAFSLSGGVYTFTDGMQTLTLNVSTGDLLVSGLSAVPEPSTYAALAGGLALAGAWFTRRRRISAA
ncbi:beta strand repeat-containing protein [Rariglobus hedericola]|uniref:PEP-CTERM sorting domain-containing protein n=1 Tax=Rariglobus hedericola TaxID=2597822 RepID=A0A556QS70_9BACT|nr:autotransporter-associated beta strand repeat-containing protein [Rariglobus hedericola]TSJ79472.1 PEP-CTERM sorting domain-containing protein [Rariglobus hedericola]